jgi:hypothetical protein
MKIKDELKKFYVFRRMTFLSTEKFVESQLLCSGHFLVVKRDYQDSFLLDLFGLFKPVDFSIKHIYYILPVPKENHCLEKVRWPPS